MKKLLLIIIVISLALTGVAQNYQCLQPGVKRYFTNTNGYLRGIRIDSMIASGSDLIYYPYHTPRGAYGGFGGSPSYLDTNGGSWLGKRVVQKSNGSFLFDNIWGDTIFVNTQAHIGDSWVFYNDTTAKYYVAHLTSVDTMTVWGTIDSVKTIFINAYNATGIDASDSMNNFHIILSKDHGFVRTFDLYTFPYHAPDALYGTGRDYYLDVVVNDVSRPSRLNSIFSQSDYVNPTRMQLYDRNPGDVFEYSVHEPVSFWGTDPIGSYYPYHYYLDSVTTRLSFPDSITCEYSGWFATQHITGTAYAYASTHFPYDVVTTSNSATFTNQLFFNPTLMPEEYHQPNLHYYLPDDTTYCTTSPAYRLEESEIKHDHWQPFFEASGVVSIYKIGFGNVFDYFYDAGIDAEHSTILIYSVKLGVPCRSRLSPVPSAIHDLYAAGNGCDIYPNPASGPVILSSAQKIESIAICDLAGRNLMTGLYDSLRVQLDITDLPSGVYIVRINGSIVRKLVKQ